MTLRQRIRFFQNGIIKSLSSILRLTVTNFLTKRRQAQLTLSSYGESGVRGYAEVELTKYPMLNVGILQSIKLIAAKTNFTRLNFHHVAAANAFNTTLFFLNLAFKQSKFFLTIWALNFQSVDLRYLK